MYTYFYKSKYTVYTKLRNNYVFTQSAIILYYM